MSKVKKPGNADHVRGKNAPTPSDEVIEARLQSLLEPAILGQRGYAWLLGLRERILSFPVMVAAVLTLLWLVEVRFERQWYRYLTSVTDPRILPAWVIADIYRRRWRIGVSSQGPIIQSVKVRPRLKDSGLVAWEAPWRESKTAEPSDNVLEIEYRQSTRLQRTVNVEVASLHATPVAETVDNARRQQGLAEK
jgi:hypothetical protein